MIDHHAVVQSFDEDHPAHGSFENTPHGGSLLPCDIDSFVVYRQAALRGVRMLAETVDDYAIAYRIGEFALVLFEVVAELHPHPLLCGGTFGSRIAAGLLCDEPLKLLLGILLFALLLAYPVGHLAFVGGQPRTVLLVGLFVGPKGLELLYWGKRSNACCLGKITKCTKRMASMHESNGRVYNRSRSYW